MVPGFEAAAFALEEGEVSDLVRTEFGYHILRCEAKESDRVRISHILVLLLPGREDVERQGALADSIRTLAVAGEDFASLARQFSDDPDSRERGGSLGVFAVDDLAPALSEAIGGLRVGEVSDLVESDLGYHIIRLDASEASRRAEFEEIKTSLRDFLFQRKLEEKSSQWLDELRQDIYVENRLFDETPVEGGEEPEESETEAGALEPPQGEPLPEPGSEGGGRGSLQPDTELDPPERQLQEPEPGIEETYEPERESMGNDY
jgi:parvulin-like peptidyl-prolyl isomerase